MHFAWADDSATVTVTIPPPDADFDSDGDIDGRDFLAWQRGYGIQAPNATNADGDADNDLDVGGDDLGILGREGVYAVNIWGGGSYSDGAFDMFLDDDGAGGTIGDSSIDADTSNIAQSAVYASVDSSDPRQASLQQRRDQRHFVASGGLDDDQGRGMPLDLGYQECDACRGVFKRDDFGPIMASDVQLFRSYVHAPKQGIGSRIGCVKIVNGARPFLANAGSRGPSDCSG